MRTLHPDRCTLLFAAMAAIAFGALPARAQLGFTEFTLSDSTLNSSPATDFWIASAAPADADGDGDLDLLVAGYYVIYPDTSNPDGWAEDRLTLYRNDGPVDGATWALTPIAVDPGPLTFGAGDLAWGDYDRDGDPDVVVAGAGATALYRNDGGTLVRTATVLPDYWEDSDFLSMDQRSISWADADNDGDLDLLVPSIPGEWSYAPTALLRNDGAGSGDAWTFTDVGAGLPAAGNGVSAWADMEGDGDLDLLLGNMSPWGDSFLATFRNDAGTLVPVDTGLASISYGTADWGDAEGDGDLDIVYAGNIELPDGSGETVVRILFNTGAGTYTPFDIVHDFESPDEPWLDFSAVTWADYDSDGDVDLLVSGEWLGTGEIFGRAVVYANTGGTFTLASTPLPAPVAGNAGGAFTWFDIDADGDLDYFVAGGYYVPDGNGLIEARTQLFRNDASLANASPSQPTNLTANAAGDGVTLAWDPALDDRTPQLALTYDLEVVAAGTPSAAERVLPEAGNVSRNTTWALHGLATGTYRWKVRALDSAFNGGPAAQGSFTIGNPTGVEPGGAPHTFALSASDPNPIRASTRFTLWVDHEQHVVVAVYDVQGRRAALLHEGMLPAGAHFLSLDRAGLASGTYFIRASGSHRSTTRRVTLLR